jgi:hypothetical protein
MLPHAQQGQLSIILQKEPRGSDWVLSFQFVTKDQNPAVHTRKAGLHGGHQAATAWREVTPLPTDKRGNMARFAWPHGPGRFVANLAEAPPHGCSQPALEGALFQEVRPR